MFAPHYAAPLLRTVASEAALHAGRDPASEVLATLRAGSQFEMLELAGGLAWGIAAGAGLVGYLDASKLEAGPVA